MIVKQWFCLIWSSSLFIWLLFWGCFWKIVLQGMGHDGGWGSICVITVMTFDVEKMSTFVD